MNSSEVNKIICGDCMETMRGMGNKSVDLIVTDIPYGEVTKNGAEREKLIASSDIGDLVFDPCLGSGTTAVAAIKTERKFLGCDIKKEYCEIANARRYKLEMEIREREREYKAIAAALKGEK